MPGSRRHGRCYPRRSAAPPAQESGGSGTAGQRDRAWRTCRRPMRQAGPGRSYPPGPADQAVGCAVMDADDGGWVRRALPGFFDPLEVVASVPTTMARAAELAAAGAPEGATVVAEEQTEGRG